MKRRSLRRPRRGRIEIIPMIDVMFFLLATFMLASLEMQNLHALRVDLPRGHASPLPATPSITLTVMKSGGLFLNQMPVSLASLATDLPPLLRGADQPIIVAADTLAPNGLVIQAMLKAREAGAQRFVFAIHRD